MDASRKHEWAALGRADADRRVKRWLYAVLALTVLVATLLVLFYRSDGDRKEAVFLLAKYESEEKETIAKAKSKDAERLREEAQRFADRVAVVRALAQIGSDDDAERAVAVVRLTWLASGEQTDPQIRELLANFRGVWNRSQAVPAELKPIRENALQAAIGFRQALLQGSPQMQKRLKAEREVIFEAARSCAKGVVDNLGKDKEPLRDAAPYINEFRVLYWGEMGLVEGPTVEGAMVRFGDVIARIEAKAMEQAPPSVRNFAKGLGLNRAMQLATKKGATDQALEEYFRARKVGQGDLDELDAAFRNLDEALEAELKSDVALDEPLKKV